MEETFKYQGYEFNVQTITNDLYELSYSELEEYINQDYSAILYYIAKGIKQEYDKVDDMIERTNRDFIEEYKANMNALAFDNRVNNGDWDELDLFETSE